MCIKAIKPTIVSQCMKLCVQTYQLFQILDAFFVMADYWKSNAKKWCEICKIWIADNRIQVENHERGLKHKGLSSFFASCSTFICWFVGMLQQKLRDMGKASKQREDQVGWLTAWHAGHHQRQMLIAGQESQCDNRCYGASSAYGYEQRPKRICKCFCIYTM